MSLTSPPPAPAPPSNMKGWWFEKRSVSAPEPLKNWKQRFFQVEKKHIVWYETDANEAKAKGMMNLHNASVDPPSSDPLQMRIVGEVRGRPRQVLLIRPVDQLSGMDELDQLRSHLLEVNQRSPMMAPVRLVPTPLEYVDNQDLRRRRPWVCWGDYWSPKEPANSPNDTVHKVCSHPFDVLIALAATQLAYTTSKPDNGQPLEFGTASNPFELSNNERCYARFTVDGFVDSKTDDTGSRRGGIQRVTLLAEVHTGERVRRLLIFAFRGSEDLLDWVRNTSLSFDKEVFANEELNTHSGFASAYSDPKEHRVLMETLGKHASTCDGLIFTGHSLGGAVAQVASLRARQFHQNLSAAGHIPRLDVLKPVFTQLHADEDKKKGVLRLLDGTRCITFAAPMPFAPKGKASTVRAWLNEHAVNYCCGTDVAPMLPRYTVDLHQAVEKGVTEMTEREAGPLISAYLEFKNDGVRKFLAALVPSQARSALIRKVTKALGIVKDATKALHDLTREYQPLVPTVFVGPDEPGQGSSFSPNNAKDEVTEQLELRKRKLVGTPWRTLTEAAQWHRMYNLAPFVIASTTAKPPDGLYVPAFGACAHEADIKRFLEARRTTWTAEEYLEELRSMQEVDWSATGEHLRDPSAFIHAYPHSAPMYTIPFLVERQHALEDEYMQSSDTIRPSYHLFFARCINAQTCKSPSIGNTSYWRTWLPTS